MSTEQANVIFYFTPEIETWTTSLCVVHQGLSMFYVGDKRLLLHVHSPTGNIIHTFVVLALPFTLYLFSSGQLAMNNSLLIKSLAIFNEDSQNEQHIAVVNGKLRHYP